MVESCAVPIQTLPDGRQFITDQDCEEHPEVYAFVKRFSNYWRRAEANLEGWVGPSQEEMAELYKPEQRMGLHKDE